MGEATVRVGTQCIGSQNILVGSHLLSLKEEEGLRCPRIRTPGPFFNCNILELE